MKLEPAGAAAIADLSLQSRASPHGSADAPAHAAPKGTAHRLVLALVWLTVYASFVVLKEPAPFDLLMMGLIVLLPAVGLVAIRTPHLAYFCLWLIVVATGFIATGAALEPEVSSIYIGITLYLALASFIIAAFVARRPEAHARLILRAYSAAAVAASCLAILGYFDIVPGARTIFTVHMRASGTFKDPNVLGPFLVPPLLYLLQESLSRRALGALSAAAGITVIALALLLTFSRGAWINLAVAAAVYLPLAFVTARTDRQRARLLGLVGILAAGAALLVAAALEIEAVAKLFTERAALAQSYDQGPEGRFGGQLKAIDVILEHPFGIGALQFGGQYHSENPHNVYLSQFLNGGWLGGLAYIAIVLASVRVAWRSIRQPAWSSRVCLVVFASLIGLAVEGMVVETDHWRTFFIVLGLAWGLAYPSPVADEGAPRRLISPLPARPPRPPRLIRPALLVRMSAVPPPRRRRRRVPKRRPRLVLH